MEDDANVVAETELIELVCLACGHEWETEPVEAPWEHVCPACGESDYIPRSIGA